jgi:23S rRNA (cytosine1962-C5)-methyltransferase
LAPSYTERIYMVMKDTYQLLDSGDGKKWERFGEYTLLRPCPQAIWRPKGKEEADAFFTRDEGNQWHFKRKLPDSWEIQLKGIWLKIALTDFGHLGVFPEHASLWSWMRSTLSVGDKVLNLFAYSGGATLAAALSGAHVCHLDASKGMVDWARENARRNQLSQAPVRWIVDDALKFLKRELKRGVRYEGIILDPPTFGRGCQGEVFKIERDLVPLLELCRALLSNQPRFLIVTCHTPGFTPMVLSHLFEQVFQVPSEVGEMLLESPGALSIPCGTYVRAAFNSEPRDAKN